MSWREAWPGLAVSAVVAVAATFLSLHYHASVMLFALLLGMALHFLAEEGRCLPGIQLASSVVLRTGVALLGLRITFDQVAALGWVSVAMVVVTVVLTIAAGVAIARILKLGSAFGTLTGGAVAICGASAALAIASILPRHPHAERDASFTVIGVTALSTLAMILYPLGVGALGLDHHAQGVFLGGTIHDVAQVVGAGYGVSQETGDTATIVKLLRVAMLLPVCVAIGIALHVRGSSAARAAPVLPWFALVFALLVAVNSFGMIPAVVVDAGSTLSRACLVTAIAAIGMKTSLRSLVDMGMRPVLLIVAETLVLALAVLAVIAWK
ncbi:MAG TPA: putative sulfate exporter family transporter [Usitatibacter sp.]|nr:putative sulfate exporter family transporter [Usitatibacter sp.]